MTRSLKAEVLKLTTVRGTYGLFVGAIVVVVLTVASTVTSAKASSMTGPVHEQVFFLLTAINVGLFSLILGMRSITDEYRNSTIVHSFLSDPGRARTLGAKAIAAAVTASALAAVSLIALTAIAVPLAGVKGGSLVIAASDTSAFAGFIAANALWAVVGVGIGSVIRHQVAAIVGGLVWVLVIENLGSGFLGDAGGYLPGQAAYALAGAVGLTTTLEVSAAAMTMGLYALIALSLGTFVTRMRDVT